MTELVGWKSEAYFQILAFDISTGYPTDYFEWIIRYTRIEFSRGITEFTKEMALKVCG